MLEEGEVAVSKSEAIKQGYRQSSKGTIVSFLLNEQDAIDALAALPLGEVLTIYVTKKDIGI